MAVQLYRRHGKKCSGHRPEWDKSFRKCKCPIIAEGMLNDKWVRRSTKKATFDEAQRVVDEWALLATRPDDRPPQPDDRAAAVSLEAATKAWYKDADEGRHLAPNTLKKYSATIDSLKEFIDERGIKYLVDLDTPTLRVWREGWTLKALAASKQLERVRSFFRFCVDSGWIDKNPATTIKAPKITPTPTLPFADDEWKAILAAASQYSRYRPLCDRMVAFVLVLRYSGLRMGDAVSLTENRIDKEGRLFLYTAKTGEPVRIPLPAECLGALAKLTPSPPKGYLFWKPEGETPRLETAKGNMRDSLGQVFRLAGVVGGHAHRFRDTFAVELLRVGVSLEDVSILLGHASIRVTERHYAPWVKARQDRLETAVKKAWGETPAIPPPTEGAEAPQIAPAAALATATPLENA